MLSSVLNSDNASARRPNLWPPLNSAASQLCFLSERPGKYHHSTFLKSSTYLLLWRIGWRLSLASALRSSDPRMKAWTHSVESQVSSKIDCHLSMVVRMGNSHRCKSTWSFDSHYFGRQAVPLYRSDVCYRTPSSSFVHFPAHLTAFVYRFGAKTCSDVIDNLCHSSYLLWKCSLPKFRDQRLHFQATLIDLRLYFDPESITFVILASLCLDHQLWPKFLLPYLR